MSAPRSGPDARSKLIGGPACRKVPRSRPSASRAGRTSTRSAPAASHPREGLGVGGVATGVGEHAGEVTGGAGHRRLPGRLGHRDRLRAQGVREERDARRGNRDLRGQQPVQRLGPSRERSRPLGRVEPRHRPAVGCRHLVAEQRQRRGGWPRRSRAGPRPRPRRGPARTARDPAGRRRSPSAETTTGSRRPAADADLRAERTAAASSARRVGVGAVAEDEVEQEHAARRVAPPRRRSARGAATGRSSGAAGRGSASSSPKSMTTWPGSRRSSPRAQPGRERDVGRGRAEHRRGDEHRLVAERAAGRRPRAARARPGVRPRRRPRRRPPTRSATGAPTPTADSTDSTAAVRSGRPGTERGQVDRLAERRRRASRASAATSGAGGLETTTIELVAGSAASAASACRRRAGRDGRRTGRGRRRPRQVADADPGGVEQAADLLGAGAGGGDRPTGPGAHDVGEAEPDAADDRGAAVGAHDEHVRGGRGVLEAHLVLDRDVVAEDHDREAGPSASSASVNGVLPRHRDQREVGTGEADRPAEGPGLRRRAEPAGSRRGSGSGSGRPRARPARRRSPSVVRRGSR